MKLRNERMMIEDTDIYLHLSECHKGLVEQTDVKLVSLSRSTKKVTVDDVTDGMPVKIEKYIGMDLCCLDDASEEPLYTEMDFLQDGRLVAIDCNNQELVMFDEQLKIIVRKGLRACPYGIVVTIRNEIAVTYGEQIDIFDIDQNNEPNHIKTISDISKHHLICVKDEDEYIVGECLYSSDRGEYDVELTDADDDVDYEDTTREETDNNIYVNTNDYEETGDYGVDDNNDDVGGDDGGEDYTNDNENDDEYNSNEEYDKEEEREEDDEEEIEHEREDEEDDDENDDAQEKAEFIESIYSLKTITTSGEERNLDINISNYKTIFDIAYIKADNKVVVSDLYGDKVDIYDVTTNCSTSVVDDRIRSPCGVAIGAYNSIFVCCSDINSICKISKTGEVLSSHEIDMENPSFVCISKDKTKLAVTNNEDGNCKLYVFRIL